MPAQPVRFKQGVVSGVIMELVMLRSWEGTFDLLCNE